MDFVADFVLDKSMLISYLTYYKTQSHIDNILQDIIPWIRKDSQCES